MGLPVEYQENFLTSIPLRSASIASLIQGLLERVLVSFSRTASPLVRIVGAEALAFPHVVMLSDGKRSPIDR